MCGRYTLTDAKKALAEILELETPSNIPPRYNIAPTQNILTITRQPDLKITFMRWGLIPSWVKTPSRENPMINARAEGVCDKPSFRESFRKRRCLIPADGFYEWKRRGKYATPMLIRFKQKRPFLFAGLWDAWRSPRGETVQSCALITTEPNRLVQPIHHRMPVILQKQNIRTWLNPDIRDEAVLTQMLSPHPDEDMEAFPVSKRVNDTTYDNAALLIKAPAPAETNMLRLGL